MFYLTCGNKYVYGDDNHVADINYFQYTKYVHHIIAEDVPELLSCIYAAYKFVNSKSLFKLNRLTVHINRYPYSKLMGLYEGDNHKAGNEYYEVNLQKRLLGEG
jgi:hypothetical protein